MSTENLKIALPNFLKILTSNNVSVPKAMAAAAKIYKEFNTPSMLSQLTDVKLKSAGIDDKDDRRLVLAAVRKAGYVVKKKKLSESASLIKKNGKNIGDSHDAGPSTSTQPNAVQVVTTPKRKRKRDDRNEFLPDGPIDEAASFGSLEFNEVLDEEVLKTKSTVINRAPLMTAWAAIVAERMGFQREEALSIASVYTEMNAISKGVSLGIFEEGRKKDTEAVIGGTQPYVDLMGRRPLYQTQSTQWRALSSNVPVQPGAAFSYISRSLRQTTPHIIGALRLLAETFSPEEINKKGWGLYAEFRPPVDSWGKRGEVRCDQILGLRKSGKSGSGGGSGVGVGSIGSLPNIVKNELPVDEKNPHIPRGEDEPVHKKPRGFSLEEYEAMLDQDTTFDNVDLNFDDPQ